MTTIALIREGKIPVDNRVALTPAQCKWVQKQYGSVKIIVQQSPHRCFDDTEYLRAGIEVKEEVAEADIFLGIKEVPLADLVQGKTYLFFLTQKRNRQAIKSFFKPLLKKKLRSLILKVLNMKTGNASSVLVFLPVLWEHIME